MRASMILILSGAMWGALASPLQAQESAAQQSAEGQQRPYRINPGDEIEVYVWGEERLQRSVKILPDGTFAFPLAGQIDAANKLPRDIENEISRGLKAQYRENVPQVTVMVRAAAGLQFSVAGKVKSPGSFTPGRYLNVLEGLTMAGGPAEFADVSNVTILRKAGGRLSSIKVRLSDVLKGNPTQRDLSGIPQLESGDTVIVP